LIIMTAVSLILYASGAEIEISKKQLTSGEFVQLTVKYDQPESNVPHMKDAIVFTLSKDYARELITGIERLL